MVIIFIVVFENCWKSEEVQLAHQVNPLPIHEASKLVHKGNREITANLQCCR